MNYSRLWQGIALTLLAATGIALAQSTLGVVVGTVKDASGAVLTAATIRLTNSGEGTTRDGKATADGSFEFQNVKPGVYAIKVSAPGFRAFAASDIRVAARQTVRVDADMQLGDVTQVVEVSSSAGVIATDSPIISSTLSAEKVLNLPGNVRGVSTSPYALIATLPGVQADNGGGYSIQGGLPAQSESSVDGISITAATGNSPNGTSSPASNPSRKSASKASATTPNSASPATSPPSRKVAPTNFTAPATGTTRIAPSTPAPSAKPLSPRRSLTSSASPSAARSSSPNSTTARTGPSSFHL